MNPLEKSRLVRVMKNISDAILVILIVAFVLTLTSRHVLFVLYGPRLYSEEIYKEVNAAGKIIMQVLVSGKIAPLALIVHQFRKLFISIIDRHPFEKTNVRRVYTIGCCIFLFALFQPLQYVLTMLRPHPMPYNHIDYVGIAQSLFIGFIVLVVAEAFRVGSEMYCEQKLTV